MIYFIQADGLGHIKIGFTESTAEARLADFLTGSPVSLRLLGSIPGTAEDEKDLHRRFAAHRVHGEWFRPVPELLELARRGAGAPPSCGGVEVAERSVSIRVLTVGRKQFTRALLDQLPAEPIIGPSDGNLRGTPWGQLRLPRAEEGVLDVVWEWGGNLCRSLTPRLKKGYPGYVRNDSTFYEEAFYAVQTRDAYHSSFDAAFAMFALANPGGVQFTPTSPGSSQGEYRTPVGRLTYRHDRDYRDNFAHHLADYFRHCCQPGPSSDATRLHHASVLTSAAKKRAGGSLPATLEDAVAARDAAKAEAERAYAELSRLEAAYAAAYESLASLPQLFIGV